MASRLTTVFSFKSFLWLLFALQVGVHGQATLPPCPVSGYFHMCRGSYTFLNGDTYSGEWRDDKKHGNGTYSSSKGDKYVGEFRHDDPQGKGIYVWANGDRYAGDFGNGEANGNGSYTWSNGDKYVGEFRAGRSNGAGTYTWANGDRYVGEFRSGKRHVKGTYIFQSTGVRVTGNWAEGAFIGTSGLPEVRKAPASSARVKLARVGGTFAASGLVNGMISVDFIIDSGAADVTLPADLVLALIKLGSIESGDLRGFKVYELADGSTIRNRTFNLKTLTLGGVTIKNVEAAVVGVNGPALLGQSYLNRLRSWSIDNATSELVLIP